MRVMAKLRLEAELFAHAAQLLLADVERSGARVYVIDADPAGPGSESGVGEGLSTGDAGPLGVRVRGDPAARSGGDPGRVRGRDVGAAAVGVSERGGAGWG